MTVYVCFRVYDDYVSFRKDVVAVVDTEEKADAWVQSWHEELLCTYHSYQQFEVT